MRKPYKQVSVIMPVYNGEKYIAHSIQAVTNTLKHHGIPHEVIVVDDGSEYNTRREALRAASKHIETLCTRVIEWGRYSKGTQPPT